MFDATEEELAAVKQLGAEQELSDQAVLRQALRLYQKVHIRLKAGETFSFSGDAQRAAEFAALASPTPSEDVVEQMTEQALDALRERYVFVGRLTTADLRFACEYGIRHVLARLSPSTLMGGGSG